MKRLLVAVAYALAFALYLALGWLPGVVMLAAALFGTVRTLVGTAHALAPILRCPRGHSAPTYGTVRCSACGWVGEGSVFFCAHCDARYGHTPCPVCGLSVRNPSL